LHVGVYDGGDLRYVSRVGGGFDGRLQKQIWSALQGLRREASPFAQSPRGRENHWVEPTLVCEVRFTEWTSDGGLRHPIFLGLRADKRPEDCRREAEADEAPEPALEPALEAAEADRPAPPREAEPREVRLSNLRKVFWPDD